METDGILPVGAKAAFRVFTEEAVILMGNNFLSTGVRDDHIFRSQRAPY